MLCLVNYLKCRCKSTVMDYDDLTMINENNRYLTLVSDRLYKNQSKKGPEIYLVCRIIMIKFTVDITDECPLYTHYGIENFIQEEIRILLEIDWNIRQFCYPGTKKVCTTQ